MTTKEDKNDYGKGLIYKIKCLDPKIRDIYVGSTLNEVARRKSHKKSCNNPNTRGYNIYVYQFIRSNGGWENWKLVPIKLYPCNSKLELRIEEERMIEELEEFTTLNRQRAFLSDENRKLRTKKYRAKHLVKQRERERKYTKEHKEEIAERRRVKYICECGETIAKYCKSGHEKSDRHQHWLKTGEQKVIKGEKYTCDCGSTLTKVKKKRHEKTIKHQKYLKSLT